MQTPPMVSAVKVKGVPLYKMARKGMEVERKARLIHVYNFRFSKYDEPIGFFRMACTKGTYVRALAHELGQKLGCGAHLATLRRVVSGKFDVEDAMPFEDVLKLSSADLQNRVIPFLKLAAQQACLPRMKVISDAAALQPGPRPVCAAIGVFDGVHLGHQHVLRQTIADAAAASGRFRWSSRSTAIPTPSSRPPMCRR
jgi:tRNA U55 pseudouridine synthase TruB